jgi:hypothetical protein
MVNSYKSNMAGGVRMVDAEVRMIEAGLGRVEIHSRLLDNTVGELP